MRYIDSWLTGLGLEYVIPKLKANNITTPKKLAQLTLRDMYEIVGVEDAEDRKKLYFLIQRLHSILNKDSPSNKSRSEEDVVSNASPDIQSSVPSAGHTPDSLANNIQDTVTTSSITQQKRDDELMKSTGTERSNGSEEDLRVLRRNRRNSIETSNRSKIISKPIDTGEEDAASIPSSGRGPVKVPFKSTTSAKRTGLTGSSSAQQIDTSASPAKRPTTRSASARNISASSTANRPVSKRVASARTIQTVTDDETDKQGPSSSRDTNNAGKQRQQPALTNKPPLSPGRGAKPVSLFSAKPSQTSGVSKVKSLRHESGVPSPPSPLAIRHTNPQERRDLQRRLSAEYLHPNQESNSAKEHKQHQRSPSDDVDYAAAYDYDDEINQYRQSDDHDDYHYSNQRNINDSAEQYEKERNQYQANTDDYSDYEAEVEEVRTWDENDVYDEHHSDYRDQDTHIEDMAIRVVLRKRPISRKELANGDYDVLEMLRGGVVDVHEPKTKVDLTKVVETQRFVFDDAFDETETNEVIYRRTMQHLMRFAFEGGKASCFAYGQTGSGKTFSMMGSRPDAPQEATVNAGLYVLAARDVFSLIEEPQYSHLKVMVSCFEIYGGKLFDLLNGRGIVRCLEDAKQQVQIKGLTEHEVQNVEELLHIMACAHEQRSTGSTGANDESSRSHQILQLCIKEPTQVIRKYGRDVVVPAKGSAGADGRARGGKISFIDLAGSERGADTNHSSKQTRMEGAEINTSLLALKEVIRSLERKHGHTPFRGSKLTQVLKDSFVGEKTRTCMIACVSPSHSNCEHTLNTLRYADRVKEHRSGGSAGPASHVGSSNYDSLAYNANLAQRPRTANPVIENRPTDVSNYDEGEAVPSRSRASLLVKQSSARPKTANVSSSEERAPVLDHKRRAEKENMVMQQRRIESAQNLRASAINGMNPKSNRGVDSMSNRAKSVNTAGSRRKSLLAGGSTDVAASSPNRGTNNRNGSRRSLLVPEKSRQPPPPPIQRENVDDSFSKRPPAAAVGRTNRRASTGANHRSTHATEDMNFKRVGSSSSSHNPSLDYNDVYPDPTLGSGSAKMHQRDISDSKASNQRGKQLSISVDADELLALPAEHLHDRTRIVDDDDNSEDYGNDAGVVSDDEGAGDSDKFDNTEVIQRTVGLLSAHKLAIAEMVEVMKDEMELVQEMENVDDRNSELYIDKLERILAIKSEAIGSLRNELNSFQQFRSAIDV